MALHMLLIILRKEAQYVLNITNTAAILVRNEVTGKIEVDLN